MLFNVFYTILLACSSGIPLFITIWPNSISVAKFRLPKCLCELNADAKLDTSSL